MLPVERNDFWHSVFTYMSMNNFFVYKLEEKKNN